MSLGYGKREGKMCYEIQKDILKKNSGTGPRVTITLHSMWIRFSFSARGVVLKDVLVPLARLETFRALKFSRFQKFRGLRFQTLPQIWRPELYD